MTQYPPGGVRGRTRLDAGYPRLDTGTTLASTGVTPLAYLCLPQVRWTQPALNRLETDARPLRLALSRSVAPPLSIRHQQISTAKHRSPAVDLPTSDHSDKHR